MRVGVREGERISLASIKRPHPHNQSSLAQIDTSQARPASYNIYIYISFLILNLARYLGKEMNSLLENGATIVVALIYPLAINAPFNFFAKANAYLSI